MRIADRDADTGADSLPELRDGNGRKGRPMTELIILRGLPGAGKTTYARAWVAGDREHRARVNRDDIRMMLDEGEYVHGVTEGRVLAARDAMITGLLKQGIDVICDDTQSSVPDGPRPDEAGRNWADWTVIDMTDLTLEDCLEQNAAAAPDSCSEQVIQDYHQRFIHGKGYPLPIPFPGRA